MRFRRLDRVAVWAFVIASSGVWLGCAADSAEQVATAELCLRPREIVALGRDDDEASVVSRDVDLARLGSIGWVVIDHSNLDDVLRYDADGEYVGSLVPRGQGPGEVENPIRLATDASDTVWIVDAGRKLVLIGPAGRVGREITNFRGRPYGFTAEGLPFELMVKGVESDTAVPYATVWSRAGDSLAALGPGAAPQWTGRSVRIRGRNGWVVSPELVWASRNGNTDVLVDRWDRTSVRPLIAKSALWESLRTAVEQPQRIWLADIIGIGDSAFIALARIASPGISLNPDEAPYLAILFRASAAGAIVGATLLHDAPQAFIDADHYFTLVENETGLIRIHISRIDTRC